MKAIALYAIVSVLLASIMSLSTLAYRKHVFPLIRKSTSQRWRDNAHRYAAKVSFSSESYLQNHRFWLKSFHLPWEQPFDDNHQLIQHVTSLIETNSMELPKSEMGVIIVPSKALMIALHNGKVQQQHAVVTEDIANFPIPLPTSLDTTDHSDGNSSTTTNVLKVLVCGFSPRAQHVCVAPTEDERPVDQARLLALNAALRKLTDITEQDLLSPLFSGTPPSRIYRSFVSPKINAQFILEPVERAAERTAAQIELAMRQWRADNAAYLRNTDKAMNLTDTTKRDSHPIVLVLDNVRSAHNVGSMFRTAETAGIAELVTCGITAHPPHPKLRKTAFSSIDVVPSRHFDETLAAVRTLKEEGHTIVVMETTSLSQNYTQISYPKKTAIVVGNEITGVDPRVIEMADIVAEIPTFGIKNSLNVASAAPIVIFEVLRQWTCPSSTQKN